MKKKLLLNKKTLRVLSADETKAVAGGTASSDMSMWGGCDTVSDLGCPDDSWLCTSDVGSNPDPDPVWTDECDRSLN